MKRLYIIPILCLLLSVCAACDDCKGGGSSVLKDEIVLVDLRHLNEYDLSDPSQARRMWDRLHAVSTLQGVVNRDAPRLYIRYVNNERGENVDDYWWDKYRKEGEWLSGSRTVELKDVPEAVDAFREKIKGVVVYDPDVPSTSAIASSICGVEDLVAVRYDPSPGSLYNELVNGESGLPVKCWLVNPDGSSKFTAEGNIPDMDRPSTGSRKIDPYIWFIEKYLKTGRCNTEYAAYYIDQYWLQKPQATVSNHHQLTNHDFFVSRKGFFFDLSPWEDEPATDDPGQEAGLDSRILKEMLSLAYSQNKGRKFCHIGGFPCWAFKYTKRAGGSHEDVATEWEFSRIISAYNAFKDADAIGLGALANSSFWQHFPLEDEYPQDWVTEESLKERGYLNEDGSVRFDGREFMIFYVGDYDASAWVAQTTPYIWDDPNRGKIPLMWAISPVLAERVPMVMHNFRKTASGNDYFVAADNGAGYLMPGMLQEPRELSGLPSGLDAWAEHCGEYYRKWGLSVTGFIIDGEAPALNDAGLECYSKFSYNGIVPQKVPPAMLYGNMPVLRSDYDLVSSDPAVAAGVIMQRLAVRDLPFHWFRAILKTPSWYIGVTEEVRRMNPEVELLDAPTFFELLRIYLKQTDSK